MQNGIKQTIEQFYENTSYQTTASRFCSKNQDKSEFEIHFLQVANTI